ncbi:hypothetical protein ACS5PK_10155 [Roseateles sp. DB2]|uniref:hypothetical protein n=1 Tax=Roseateles sp. DB2 TaxID=3453717 RepID=UPI003EE9C2E3
MSISGSQLTRLGERLRAGPLIEADLRMLDEYRRSFGPASERVLATLRETMDVPVTVRGAKSTQAIVEKLRRQSCRLGQIQDIAGCRLVVGDLQAQESAVSRISAAFLHVQLHDRRRVPSHSYRAVHLVVKVLERWVEIQVRTELQHLWASLSEMLADIFGNEVKYGGGPTPVQKVLHNTAEGIAAMEDRDLRLFKLASAEPPLPDLTDFLCRPSDTLTTQEQEFLERYRMLENRRAAWKAQLDQRFIEAQLKRQELKLLLEGLAAELKQFRPR